MPGRDLSRPDHLPKRRPDGQPPHPSWLPRQRRGITPQMIGRYPDYDVFSAEGSWDEKTKSVVKERLSQHGPLRFFTREEEPTLRAFCDTVMAQDAEPRIPVAEMVDAKMADRQLDGYRYADMPEDPQTWKLVLRGLDDSARERGAGSFPELAVEDRESLVDDFSHGRLSGGAWEQLNVTRAWSVVMRAVLSQFYSHPWAWNEIGFGGPAYPRGFMRLGQGPVSPRPAKGRGGAPWVLEPFETPGADARDPVRDAQEATHTDQAPR